MAYSTGKNSNVTGYTLENESDSTKTTVKSTRSKKTELSDTLGGE